MPRGGCKEEVVSLSGVNHGFWSHLGCSGGKSPPFPDVKVSFRVVIEEFKKNAGLLFWWKSITKEIMVATVTACDSIIKVMVAVAWLLLKSGFS